MNLFDDLYNSLDSLKTNIRAQHDELMKHLPEEEKEKVNAELSRMISEKLGQNADLDKFLKDIYG